MLRFADSTESGPNKWTYENGISMILHGLLLVGVDVEIDQTVQAFETYAVFPKKFVTPGPVDHAVRELELYVRSIHTVEEAEAVLVAAYDRFLVHVNQTIGGRRKTADAALLLMAEYIADQGRTARISFQAVKKPKLNGGLYREPRGGRGNFGGRGRGQLQNGGPRGGGRGAGNFRGRGRGGRGGGNQNPGIWTCPTPGCGFENFHLHKNGVGTLGPNLNRLSPLVPCGKG